MTSVRRDRRRQLADVWHYDGELIPIVRIAAAAGVPRDEVDARPITYDDMRKGFYDPAARLADMDTAGIEASVCYPNMFVRFCGQTFSLGADKDLGLACIRAYNDFVVEEWCAGSPGRLVPMGIVPLWDVDLAVAEVERLAALDFRSITFSEAPHLLGLPSIHSGQWDPLFDVCAATEIVVSLHIGTGGFPLLAKDSPGAVPNVIASFNAGYTLIDRLFSGVFARFPALKICLAESQLGWIPYVLSRADFVWRGDARRGLHRRRQGRRCPSRRASTSAATCGAVLPRPGRAEPARPDRRRPRALRDRLPAHRHDVADCLEVGEEMTSHLSAEDCRAASLADNAGELFRIEVSPSSVGIGWGDDGPARPDEQHVRADAVLVVGQHRRGHARRPLADVLELLGPQHGGRGPPRLLRLRHPARVGPRRPRRPQPAADVATSTAGRR